MTSATGELILVPMTSSAASFHALNVAGSYARQHRGKVVAAYVVEVGYEFPIHEESSTESRRGEIVLRKAEQAANEGHFPVEPTLLQARAAGRAIVDEAKRRRASVIVLGAAAGTDGAFSPNKTADYVLRKAPCEVWLIRDRRLPA